MNIKHISALLATGTIALVAAPAIADSSDAPQLNFSCQVNQGVPTTVAQIAGSEATQPIFHWKEEALLSQRNNSPQQLCDSVTAKLADYSAQGYELSNISFIGTAEPGTGLPAICLNTTNSKECSKILTTLYSNSEVDSKILAADVVSEILDPSLQEEKTVYRDRGVQATSYQVNFWDLLGFGSNKSVDQFKLK